MILGPTVSLLWRSCSGSYIIFSTRRSRFALLSTLLGYDLIHRLLYEVGNLLSPDIFPQTFDWTLFSIKLTLIPSSRGKMNYGRLWAVKSVENFLADSLRSTTLWCHRVQNATTPTLASAICHLFSPTSCKLWGGVFLVIFKFVIKQMSNGKRTTADVHWSNES